MLADFFELEADGGVGVGGGGDGNVQVAGENFGFGEAFFVGDAGEGVEGRSRAGFADDVFLPGRVAAVGAEEVGFVLGEVARAEFDVGHGEEGGREGFVVGLAFSVDVSGAPAAVDEFPLSVVDFHGVPGVALGL